MNNKNPLDKEYIKECLESIIGDGFAMTTFPELMASLIELNKATLASVELEPVLEEQNKDVGIPGVRLALSWYNPKLNTFNHEEIVVPSMLEFDKQVHEYTESCLAANKQYIDPPYFRKIAIEKVLFGYRRNENGNEETC
jgi:hypothetical protein